MHSGADLVRQEFSQVRVTRVKRQRERQEPLNRVEPRIEFVSKSNSIRFLRAGNEPCAYMDRRRKLFTVFDAGSYMHRAKPTTEAKLR